MFRRYSFTLVLLLAAVFARAELEVDIENVSDSALPIAVVPFTNRTGMVLDTNVSQIVTDDLLRSGDFETLAVSRMLSLPDQSADVFYRDWRLLGQSYVLVGQISTDAAKKRFYVQYELMDVHNQKRIIGEVIPASLNSLRKASHMIADEVYEAITGIKGVFNTKIAYISVDRDKSGKLSYALEVADTDGFGAYTAFRGSEPMLSPAWSNDGKKIAYVSFESGKSAIYIQTLKTGERKKIASFKGINSSPAWSPDDKRMLMTLSKDRNSELYLYDLSNDSLSRLTNHFAIDTEGSWAPDGRSILFTSDRSGSPQIYSMDLNQRFSQRLSFEGRYNARPRYSADGKSIFFVNKTGSAYGIAAMTADGDNKRVLTSTNLDESPSISPNGRMIIYSTKRDGKSVLGVVAVEGGAKHFLPARRGEVKEPAWSPFLN